METLDEAAKMLRRPDSQPRIEAAYLSKQRKLYLLSLTHRLNSCNNNFGFASTFLSNPRSQPQQVKVEDIPR
jgi:hypothetical protein